MYKLYKDIFTNKITQVYELQSLPNLIIPFAPGNRHYDFFKYEILNNLAQLQDADGNLMSASAAKAFVATLP